MRRTRLSDPFSQCFLSTYHMPGPAPRAGGTEVNLAQLLPSRDPQAVLRLPDVFWLRVPVRKSFHVVAKHTHAHTHMYIQNQIQSHAMHSGIF